MSGYHFVMDVAVLGPLRVRGDGIPKAIEAPKQRMLFGVLLQHAGRVVSSDRLLEEAWSGKPPSGGLKTLRYHVSKLRDVLVPDRARGDDGPILTVGSGYQLHIEPDEIDANRFEKLGSQGAGLLANGRWADAQRVLTEALDLWRGDAWQDFRYDDFAQPAIARLEELRLVCLGDRIDARLALGEHAELIGELNELMTRHPLRERFWAQSMTALYRAGRTAEALAVYETACAVLGGELGVEPNPSLQRLHRQVIDQSLPLRAHDPSGEALPHRTSSFIGRTVELDDLQRVLTSRRLVSLVGPGGVGKSSLGIEAARRALHLSDDVFFVDLTAVSAPSDVTPQVARACGVVRNAGRAALDDTVDQLGDSSRLLLIDNCEHVVDAIAPIISSILQRCPNVTVLVTSRRPLHLDGEHLYRVDPLSVPSGVGGETESDAVRLFADRAAAARGDFAVDEDNQDTVIETCRRLDGLPLGLELAAARLAVLSITELHDRLDQRFEVLVNAHMTDDRHRAMWATIDWSNELLTPQGQALLRRLAVMRGTFDLEAVAHVCLADAVGDAEVLDLITELVENSFLRRHRDPDGGFSMLETIRDYATHNLQRSGEADDLRERHARYFAQRAAARASHGSVEELDYLDQMRTDGENHTVALDWSLEHGRTDLSIQLAAGLALHWYTAGRGDDALRWLVPALSKGQAAASRERAEALCSLGLTLPWMGRHDEAAAIAAELARLAAGLQEPEVEADALWVRAAAATVAGEIAESRDLFDRAATLLREADQPKLSIFLFDLARRELMLGNTDRALALVDELEQVDLRYGQPLTAARVPLLHGLLMHFHGDLSSALSHLTSSLGEMRRLGHIGPQVDVLRAICEVAVSAEEWEMAESAAREFTKLTMGTGEIADLPHGNGVFAEVSLAHHELDQASNHLTTGLATLRTTRSAFALDHTLLTAASIALARGRTETAATLHAARRRRREALGLVDPVPTTNRVKREMLQLRGERNGEWKLNGRDQLSRRSLLDLATTAVAP